MNIAEVLRIALRTLGRNKLRMCLTMLGIIIGVTAVICILSLGASASNEVTDEIQSLGDNMLFIQAGSANTGGFQAGIGGTKTLVIGDADAIATQIPSVSFVSPEADTNAQVVYTNQNSATRIRGVGENYFDIRNWPVTAGSALSKRDIDSAADVCVIGSSVGNRLFGGDEPIDKMLRVKNVPVEVIGELKTKGQSTFGQDQDDLIMMPYTTAMEKLAGVDWLQTITASVDLKENMNVAKNQTEALLRQRHHLRTDEDNDFSIRSPDEIAQTAGQINTILTLLLGSVASISLLVGGIGIMNIMLVSVTERTREIAIRMAVAATESDVQRQFLSEALVLSSAGGLIGIVAGLATSVLVCDYVQWPASISALSIVAAVLFSAAVGIFFGYYAARKASRLDPIEALRYE